MDAVILAAGLGSRLREDSRCKPLTPIDGIPMIEIGIRQLVRAGVQRIVVVTGHEAERVEKASMQIGARLGVRVETVRLEDHSRPNGYSVLAGGSRIDGEFLLVMADHIFSSDILPKLSVCQRPQCDVVLAIDHRVKHPELDPEDATWVKHAPDGRIESIGKSLEVYDAVDCGAFRAGPALLAAISRAIAHGEPGSLSDGMQVLAQSRRAGTMDIGEAWWLDVDDRRSLEIARKTVRQALPEIWAEQQLEVGAA